MNNRGKKKRLDAAMDVQRRDPLLFPSSSSSSCSSSGGLHREGGHKETVTAVISVSIKRCTWRRHWLVLLFFFLFPSFLSRWRQLFGGGSSLLLKRRKKKERENGLEKWTKTCTVCCAPVYTRHKTNWKLTAAIVVCSFLGNSQCCIVDLILPPETPTIAVYKTNVYIYIDPSGYITIRVVSEWSPEWVCFLLSILWFLFRFCVCVHTLWKCVSFYMPSVFVCKWVAGTHTNTRIYIAAKEGKEWKDKNETKWRHHFFAMHSRDSAPPFCVCLFVYVLPILFRRTLFFCLFVFIYLYTHTHTFIYCIYTYLFTLDCLSAVPRVVPFGRYFLFFTLISQLRVDDGLLLTRH